MATIPSLTLKRTALHAVHKALGARMVEFGGWEMPVEYSGIIQEHLAVRTCAGLFDVSHMGQIEVSGPQALALLQHLTSNDVSKLQIGQAQYSALMYPQGSAVDDCLVHRLRDDHYFLCVNASNTDKDFDWILQNNSMGAEVRNVSSDYSLLAVQGPKAAAIVTKVTEATLADLDYYWFRRTTCCGVSGILARTGYTGEDGFEFYSPVADSERVWNSLLEAGRADGLIPAGLGARNTLRLEAGMALYGHELDEETTLLEAGLGRICKFRQGPVRRARSAAEAASGGCAKEAGWVRDDRPHHCSRRLLGLGRRQAGRPRHQRFLRSVSEEEYRNGLSATGVCSGGPRGWHRNSR